MRALVLVLLLALGAHGFAPPRAPHRGRPRVVRMAADDPTKTPLGLFANALQSAIQNSPIAEGKKMVVRMLAGDFDEAAANAELDRLIASEPVVMFSFPK